MICAGRQDGPPSRPPSSGGPSGPGYNQTPHQHPYSTAQQPPQSYGGHSTGLSYSASTSSSYNNATASWKKPQTGVIGLAKDTVDKLAGKETRKNVQAQVQSASSFACLFSPFHRRGVKGERNGARAYFVVPIGASAISLWLGAGAPTHPPARPHGSFLFFLIRLKHPFMAWG